MPPHTTREREAGLLAGRTRSLAVSAARHALVVLARLLELHLDRVLQLRGGVRHDVLPLARVSFPAASL